VASCIKCGGNLVAQARFCAACGSPVTTSSSMPPPAERDRPPVERDKPSVPDPFAKTVLGDATPVPPPPQKPKPETKPQPVLSPMAASVMKDPGTPLPPLPSRAQAPAQQPAWSGQPQWHPQVPAGQPIAQPAPPPHPYFVPGAMVLVYWADGNQYPGTVLQVSPYHVLVAFPNGAQQWVEMRYVTVGR
jgi:hypothetical protein